VLVHRVQRVLKQLLERAGGLRMCHVLVTRMLTTQMSMTRMSIRMWMCISQHHTSTSPPSSSAHQKAEGVRQEACARRRVHQESAHQEACARGRVHQERSARSARGFSARGFSARGLKRGVTKNER
jgi:hypothetical protein